ncbi:hypothetical protein GWK41_02900 [Persephonella atlantica]|uniref:DUF2249 domain-containing protein n=1 Tax=Persephonella atlantica TaxID=2699429 RepID=A0ABS1GGF7_9AQUI|nr:hypothetical protein [Persephonella atlantica]MBK3332014.1 hypothetical protein [Persephonella atlantica]
MAEKEELKVEGATVPVYRYEKDGTVYYEFDTSQLGPPEPMVNALSVLKLIDSPNKRAVMINHKKPMGLFDKISDRFDYKIEEINGKYRIEFWLKGNK